MSLPIPEGVDLWQIEAERQAAPHGEKRAVIERWATELGWSVDSVYRYLRKLRGKMKEVPRDVVHEEELIERVRRMKEERIEAGRRPEEASTHRCIADLVALGVLGAEKLNVSTVNQRLRKMGFYARERMGERSMDVRARTTLDEIKADLAGAALRLQQMGDEELHAALGYPSMKMMVWRELGLSPAHLKRLLRRAL